MADIFLELLGWALEFFFEALFEYLIIGLGDWLSRAMAVSLELGRRERGIKPLIRAIKPSTSEPYQQAK